MQCPQCDAEITGEAHFCARCGAFLSGAAEQRTRVAAYTPKHLADKIFNVRSALEGERKLVTVLFCDIVESTPLAAKIGAEEMHAFINRFFDAAVHEVHGCEGTINQFLGDGFMALFGAPIAHEDHARRAASAALAICRACHATVADTRAGKVPLRIGLNTGSVVVGKIGDNLRMDYTAIGDTVNMAARMQQNAAPGEILMTRITHDAIHGYFDSDALGRRRVKGKDEAVQVYRLRGPRLGTAESNRSAAPESSGLIGRERELGSIRKHLARLRRGEGGILAVSGEAGLGKSRLLQEARRAESSNVHWLVGHAASFGRNVSYAPFAEALRTLIGIDERDGRTAVTRRLSSFLEKYLAEQGASLLPFAIMLLGMELPPMASGLIGRLDPQDVRGQIFIVARRLFEALARERPTVLELEDWHWADEASISLLQHLLPVTESQSLLVCVSARPDPGPYSRLIEAVRDRPQARFEELALEPLTGSESTRLVERLFAFAHLPPVLREQILQRSEGNPLFLEEVVHAVQASGAVRPTATGTLRFAGETTLIDLPGTIDALVSARIDRLEAEAKQVLRLAAVIGRHFYRRVLQLINEAKDELDRSLERLEKSDFIKQGKPSPELEYFFKHALVHEASYRSILENRRRQLHAQVAEAIESLFSERLNEVAGSLAYHYAQAGDQARALRHLLRAGDYAARMSADIEALGHYEDAMKSYQRAFGAQWDPQERGSLERKIGEALFRLGRHEQAREYLYRCLELLGYSYPATGFGVRLGIVGHLLVQVWHRLRRARYSQHDNRPTERDIDRIHAYATLGWIDFFLDEERFFLDVLAMLNWSEHRGLGAVIVESGMGVGLACNVLSFHRVAASYHRRVQAIAVALDDPQSRTLAGFGFAFHCWMIGDWNRAVVEMERAKREFRAQGMLRQFGITSAMFAWLLQLRGDFEHAAAVAEELAQVADEAGDGHTALYAAQRLACLQASAGRLPEAIASLEKCLDELRRIRDFQIVCVGIGALARAMLWSGEIERSAAAIEDGFRLLREHRTAPHMTTDLLISDGWLQLARAERMPPSDRRSALRKLAKAVRRLHRLGQAFSAALPAAYCLQGCREWLLERPARADAAWQESRALAERIGLPYQVAVTQQETGRLTGDRAALRAALDGFTKSGCAIEIARTLRCLSEATPASEHANAIELVQRSLAMHESMNAEHERRLCEQRFRELSVLNEPFDSR